MAPAPKSIARWRTSLKSSRSSGRASAIDCTRANFPGVCLECERSSKNLAARRASRASSVRRPSKRKKSPRSFAPSNHPMNMCIDTPSSKAARGIPPPPAKAASPRAWYPLTPFSAAWNGCSYRRAASPRGVFGLRFPVAGSITPSATSTRFIL